MSVPNNHGTRTARGFLEDAFLAEATCGHRVLIVDDHPDAGQSLAMLLDLAGNQSRVVFDGFAAITEAERFRPELVLLDIGMPRIDGYETCRRMREQPWSAGMRLIALTGYSQEQDRERARAAGFDGHLVKPVDPALLLRMVSEMPRPVER
jgi:CheY-like chemotaxis protein